MNYWVRLLAGPLLATIVWCSPFSLPDAAHTLAGVMVWTLTWWILEPIPLPATALFGTALAVSLQLGSSKQAFASFGHPIIFVFLGGFLIARAMAVQGLDRRVALYLLSRPFVARKPIRVLLALTAITAFFSMWISNTATTAMMLPIAIGVAEALFPKNRGAQGTAILSIAYAASIGGMGTPVGSPPNLVTIGMLDRVAGIEINFVEWMQVGVPLLVACLLFLQLLLVRRLPILPRETNLKFIRSEYKKLGPVRAGEWGTLAVVALVFVLWVGPGMAGVLLGKSDSLSVWLKGHFPEAVGALLAASFLFVIRIQGKPLLSWQQGREIDWGALLLFGGGLALGAMVFETGLGQSIGELLNLSDSPSRLIFLIAATFFAVFFTETTSNTATASMAIPLVIPIALKAGFDPRTIALSVGLACNLAFMMPVATPPNAIVYGSGRVTINQMIHKGFLLNLGCGLLVVIFALLLL